MKKRGKKYTEALSKVEKGKEKRKGAIKPCSASCEDASHQYIFFHY